MTWRSFLVALAVLSAGCQPKIGDSCRLHTDCSQSGGRICEPNLPGGYCTEFNCEPGSCPSEAVCVAYGITPSADPVCRASFDRRLERTFCMFACASNSDCRAGYECVDIAPGSKTNPWEAAVVDNTTRHQICTVLQSGVPVAAQPNSDQVCYPPDASFPPPARLPTADSGGVARGDASPPREAGAGQRDASAEAGLDGGRNADSGSSQRDAGVLDAALGDGAAP